MVTVLLLAVPLFFMTSGALLLGREETYGQLLKHRVLRFAEVLLFVSVPRSEKTRKSFF